MHYTPLYDKHLVFQKHASGLEPQGLASSGSTSSTIFLPKVTASRRRLACTSTQVCSATNLCRHINYKTNQSHLGICHLKPTFKQWDHFLTYVYQGDAVGSIFQPVNFNFQPMRRRYATRRCETNARQASSCIRSVAEQIWVLVQARPHLLAETLRRKVIFHQLGVSFESVLPCSEDRH